MKNIEHAKDPGLRGSVAAIRRASQAARTIAIQTDTSLIIVKDGKLTRIPAHALRQAASTADR